MQTITDNAQQPSKAAMLLATYSQVGGGLCSDPLTELCFGTSWNADGMAPVLTIA